MISSRRPALAMRRTVAALVSEDGRMQPEVRPFVAREGAASVSLDGDTYSLVPSTAALGPRISGWWHGDPCIGDPCTCDTAARAVEDEHG